MLKTLNDLVPCNVGGDKKGGELERFLDACRMCRVKINGPDKSQQLISLTERKQHNAVNTCLNKGEIPRMIDGADKFQVRLISDNDAVSLISQHGLPGIRDVVESLERRHASDLTARKEIRCENGVLRIVI